MSDLSKVEALQARFEEALSAISAPETSIQEIGGMPLAEIEQLKGDLASAQEQLAQLKDAAPSEEAIEAAVAERLDGHLKDVRRRNRVLQQKLDNVGQKYRTLLDQRKEDLASVDQIISKIEPLVTK